MSFKKASYPARASGATDTVAGLSRPASRVLSSRRCGARKLAEAASPICWVARSNSKSPAAPGGQDTNAAQNGVRHAAVLCRIAGEEIGRIDLLERAAPVYVGFGHGTPANTPAHRL